MKKWILFAVAIMSVFGTGLYLQAQEDAPKTIVEFGGESYELYRSHFENTIGEWGFRSNNYWIVGQNQWKKTLDILYQNHIIDVPDTIQSKIKYSGLKYKVEGDDSNQVAYAIKPPNPANKYDMPMFSLIRVTPSVEIRFEYRDNKANFDRLRKAGVFEKWVEEMISWPIPVAENEDL